MTSAKKVSPRVRTASRPSARARHRTGLKTLAGSLTTAALVLVTVAAALIGADRRVSAAIDPRVPVFLAGTSLAPPGLESVIGAPTLANLSAPATIPAAESLATDSLALSARFAPASGVLAAPADPDVTGSLRPAGEPAASAAPPVRLAALGPVTAIAPDLAPAPAADPVEATPLPRARPKLASLHPSGGLDLTPETDAHPPRTAIYDIAGKVVYMPNGERLEAHSGLGSSMDDPRHVRIRMRGPTPPNTYNLKMREALFHGVAAIRMTPVNQDMMFGRDGILAHSYLLGPNGQSHGCVSFKDYPKFLRAFQRGEIERMIVVARLDKPPVFARQPAFKSAANTR